MQISLLLGSAANVQAFVPALFGLFRTDHMRFTQVCSSIQRLYIPAGIFVASALYVFSEALVIVLQGEEYRPAIGMLRVLCWSAALTYWRYAASTALMTGDRMRVKLLLEICANCMVLLSSLLLIKKYGSMGASYTRIIGDFSLLVLMLNYVYVTGLYPFSGLIGTTAPSIATVLAAITFTQSMPGRYFLAPILFVASSAVFWYFYLRFHPENKDVARNSW
jgi:O-antigen/teichoic acid export membrane protein